MSLFGLFSSSVLSIQMERMMKRKPFGLRAGCRVVLGHRQESM